MGKLKILVYYQSTHFTKTIILTGLSVTDIKICEIMAVYTHSQDTISITMR
jgi:hypothetical protein